EVHPKAETTARGLDIQLGVRLTTARDATARALGCVSGDRASGPARHPRSAAPWRAAGDVARRAVQHDPARRLAAASRAAARRAGERAARRPSTRLPAEPRATPRSPRLDAALRKILDAQAEESRRLPRSPQPPEERMTVMQAQLGIVSVPVSDQQRAKKFYSDVLGFSILNDQPFRAGARWIEMAPN